MGIVSRTKHVLRRAGRLENLSEERIKKAVRPFGGGLLGTKRLVARYRKNGEYLSTSLNEWVKKRDDIIAGKIKPKFVKEGGDTYLSAVALLGMSGFSAVMGYAAGNSNRVSLGGKVAAVGVVGALALTLALSGTTGVIAARKRLLFNVLNSKIHVGENISPAQVRSNRVVFNKVEELLRRLVTENDRQLGAIERYRQTAFPK